MSVIEITEKVPPGFDMKMLDKTADIYYLDLGLTSLHTMPCAVNPDNKAVLTSGVFQPCWKAQDEGWRLVKVHPKCGLIFNLIRSWLFTNHVSECSEVKRADYFKRS